MIFDVAGRRKNPLLCSSVKAVCKSSRISSVKNEIEVVEMLAAEFKVACRFFGVFI